MGKFLSIHPLPYPCHEVIITQFYRWKQYLGPYVFFASEKECEVRFEIIHRYFGWIRKKCKYHEILTIFLKYFDFSHLKLLAAMYFDLLSTITFPVFSGSISFAGFVKIANITIRFKAVNFWILCPCIQLSCKTNFFIGFYVKNTSKSYLAKFVVSFFVFEPKCF